MPELPEVQTVLTGLRPVMDNQIIAYIETHRVGLRYPFDAHMDTYCTGATVTSMQRLSKYLVIRLSTGKSLISHLGMSGKYTVVKQGSNAPLEKHDHFVIHMQSGDKVIYNDPRRFGFLISVDSSDEAEERHLKKLGVDPTGADLTDIYLYNALQKRKTNIKTALLDQSIIAGLGNIYACEALWRSGICPTTEVNTISKKKASVLRNHIIDVIDQAIKAGGSSLKDYRQADGAMGYFQHAFAVYGRENDDCNHCSTPIKRITQSGRSTFYCPQCQK